MTGQILGRPTLPDFAQAACKAQYDLWDARGKTAEQTKRDICNGCAALPECFAWALSITDGGFWAGMTTTERRRIQTRYGISARPMAVAP